MRFLQGQEFHSIILYIFISIQIHYLSSKSNAILVFHWEPQLFLFEAFPVYFICFYRGQKQMKLLRGEIRYIFQCTHNTKRENYSLLLCIHRGTSTKAKRLLQLLSLESTAKIFLLKAQSSISIFAPKLSSLMQTYLFCKMK